MQEQHKQSLQRRLETHKKNLWRLEERASKQGLNVDIETLNEIDDEREAIRKIEKALSEPEAPSINAPVRSASGRRQSIIRLRITLMATITFVGIGLMFAANAHRFANCASGLRISQWKTIDTGPSDINSVAVNPKDPTIMFAGIIEHGTFRSGDFGSTWEQVHDIKSKVNQVAIDPDNASTVYVATDKGIYKSIDSGQHWSSISQGLEGLDIKAIAVDHQDHKTVYVGTWGKGVYKSSDGGRNWIETNAGLSDQTIQVLVIDSEDNTVLFAGTHMSGVFVSIDAGRNWKQTGLKNRDVRSITVITKTRTIYAGLWDDGVAVSRDSGATWRFTNTGLTDTNIRTGPVLDRTLEGTLYIGTWSDGVFYSVDEGESWTRAQADSPVVRSITNVGSDTVLVGFQGGFYRFIRDKKSVIDCFK